jgi:single-strand DNA-binding protein
VSDTHVTITGNLTADPELKFTPNGAAVANFRIAVTTRIRDGNTWRDGETSFFRVNAWRQLAQHVTGSLSRATGRWSSAASGRGAGRRPRVSSAR